MFSKPVNKIIYQQEIQGKENIRVAKHNIEQQQEEYCSKGASQRSHHFNFTPSKYNHFSMLNLEQKIKNSNLKRQWNKKKTLMTNLCKKMNMNLQLHSLLD